MKESDCRQAAACPVSCQRRTGSDRSSSGFLTNPLGICLGLVQPVCFVAQSRHKPHREGPPCQALCQPVLIAVSASCILKCVFPLESGTGLMPVMGPLHSILWCAMIASPFLLELKIYRQWLSGGTRHLCKVVNQSLHLSIIGNFVGASLPSKSGGSNPSKFFWVVGFTHYLVVFVTLYLRLPNREA
ncbi:hypothetical protein MLD38_010912 [Melastoma candidum]|uniref:Uncharacterized protein n=1 Tax=Melastoma candidum TaxID=119954 RepID=A0ACB9R2H1_9MYRT|nr:hypothetical protein MLD38_010912 [Melastoma candidum]